MSLLSRAICSLKEMIHVQMSPVAVNGDAIGCERSLCQVPLRPGCLGVTWGEASDLLTPAPSPQSSLRSSPCTHWGPNSAWSSRRSSWNSLGRAPSLKRRSQCGERESLLSGEGKGSGSTDEEAEDSRPGVGASPDTRATLLRRTESLDHRSTLDLRPLRPAALLPTKLHDCNGLALPSELFLRIDSHKEDTAEFDDDVEDVSGGGPHVSPSPAPVVGWFPRWGLGSSVRGRPLGRGREAGQAGQELIRLVWLQLIHRELWSGIRPRVSPTSS